MEWPVGIGQIQKFPEVDNGRYFEINLARKKIHKYQKGFLDRLEEKAGADLSSRKKTVQGKLV